MTLIGSDLGIVIALLLLLLVSLSNTADSSERRSCENLQPFDPQRDYFPVKAAKHMCNTPHPSTNLFSAGTKFFSVPASFAAAAHPATIRFIERLGIRNRLRHVPSVGSLTSPCLLELAREGFTQGVNPGWNGEDVDVVFGAIGTNDSGVISDLDVASMRNGVVLPLPPESPPLEHSSLLILASLFFNLEEISNTMFTNIERSYSCAANGATAALQSEGGRRPVVAWMGRREDGKIGTEAAGWKSRALMDAGVTSIVSPSFADPLDILPSLRSVDVLIDDTIGSETMSDVARAYSLSGEDYAKYAFLKDKMVFRWDARRSRGGVDDFPRSQAAMADHIIRDLVAALWPGAVGKGWRREWLRNVARDKLSQQPNHFNSAIPIAGSLLAAICVLGIISFARIRRRWQRERGYVELERLEGGAEEPDQLYSSGSGAPLGSGEEVGWEGEDE
ncbi:hypothetical protein HDU93_002679 [Gonapodya sp. JEL0774]|nr:hypothetical protein HDU93_002679 [Gonapodya sp. JEL0774]